MKQIQTDAIILKRINFAEADRILTILTPGHGKLSVIAKGVRKPKSKLAGGLELLSVSEITYIEGKSDLKTVVSTRLKTHFKNIVSDVARTMSAYDFMKQTDSLTDHSREPEYYELLLKSLESLDDKSLPTSLIEIWFYSTALKLNGNAINVEKPINESKFEEEKAYNFSYDDMSFFEHDSGTFSPNHIKFLRLLTRSREPRQLMSIVGSGELSASLRDVIKQAATMHKA